MHASLPRATSALLLVILTGAVAAQTEKKKDSPIQPDGLKNLRHPDANVRYQTAALLAEQGPLARFAVEELREALKDTDALVRVKVAEAIWKVERPSPSIILPSLQRALKEKNPEVRAAACGVIGLMGAKAKGAIPVVVDTLKDKDLTVVIAAVNALGDLGPVAHETAGAMLQLAGYADFVVLEPFVGAALGSMGEPVVPELIAALSEKSLERRRVAAYALGSIGPQAQGAVKALAKTLRDDPPLRYLAARALGNIGKEAKSALPRLREATTAKDAQARIRAALAIWQVGGETDCVGLLAEALRDDEVPARTAACQALTTMGPDARAAAPALTRALKDREPTVKQAAVIALASIGPDARDSAAALRPLLKDADKMMRQEAALALWRVTGDAAESLAALQPCLRAEPRLQAAAIEKLGTMGAAARAMLPELVTMFREEDNTASRRAIGEAIKKIDPALAAKLGIR